jgi:hypothetical protein
VIAKQLLRFGARPIHFQVISLGLIWLNLSLWIRAKTVDQDQRANAERRAMFVGLWPVMFWLIGDAVEREERSSSWRSRLGIG